MPSTRSYRENISILRAQQRDLAYTERTWATTGRLNSDNTTDNDTTADLDDGLMWVRVKGARGETAAVIGAGMSDFYTEPDKKIRVGYNDEGELVAIEPYRSRATAQTQGTTGLKEANRPLPARLLMGLRVLPPRDHSTGTWVFLEAEPTLGWLGGDVDVSSGVPGSSGEYGWTVVYFDPADRLPYVYVHPAEVKPSKEALPFDAAALVAALPYGVYPAGAVSLAYGQTGSMRADSRYEDLRRFVDATGTVNAGWLVKTTTTLPAAMVQPGTVRVAASLTLNAALYVI